MTPAPVAGAIKPMDLSPDGGLMSETRSKPGPGLRIMCPTLTCRKILAVPEAARGKTVRCKYCNASIRIPAKKEPPVHLEASEAKPGQAA